MSSMDARALAAASRSGDNTQRVSILGGPLEVLDHQDWYRRDSALELQSQIVLNSGEDSRIQRHEVSGGGASRRQLNLPREIHIDVAGKSALIDDQPADANGEQAEEFLHGLPHHLDPTASNLRDALFPESSFPKPGLHRGTIVSRRPDACAKTVFAGAHEGIDRALTHFPRYSELESRLEKVPEHCDDRLGYGRSARRGVNGGSQGLDLEFLLIKPPRPSLNLVTVTILASIRLEHEPCSGHVPGTEAAPFERHVRVSCQGCEQAVGRWVLALPLDRRYLEGR